MKCQNPKPVLQASVNNPALDDKWAMKMQVDQQALDAIRSHTRRLERKRQLLADYSPYLSTLSGASETDRVLVRCLIWAADVGEWGLVLRHAQWALSANMSAPDGFKRDLREILLDSLSEQVNQPHPVEYWERLADLVQVEQGDMRDRTRATFYKTWALKYQSSEPRRALELLHLAQHYGARVTTLLKRLQPSIEDLQHESTDLD